MKLTKQLLFLPLVFFLLLITVIVLSPQKQVSAQTNSNITPTLYCLGSCPNSAVDKTISEAPQKTVSITPQTTLQAPAQGGPADVSKPTADEPCATSESSIQHDKQHKKSSDGSLSKFFEYLMKFIELLLKALGIPLPENPGTNPTPTTSPPIEPSPSEGAIPSPSEEPSPTVSPCPSPSASTAPSTQPSTEPTISTAPSQPVGGIQPSGQGGKPSAFWIHWNSTPASDSMLATEAKRRKVILLNAWEGGLIPKLKAANPNILVFAYKDLTSTRSYACKGGVDDASMPTGVGYCDADKNHPDWFMQRPGGGRFEYSGYSGHWQMDVGNPSYQQAWINNVKTELTAKKFDGVIMDNALFACDDYHGGTCPTKYPNDEVFQAAYVAMMSKAKAELNAAGLKTMANLNGARTHAGMWNKYMAHLDGGFDEFWMAFSSSDMLPNSGTEGWKAVMDEITTNEAQGKITLVQPHFNEGDTKTFRYTFASYLMANGGNASYSEISQRDGYGDPPVYHPEFDWNLGAPSGAYTSVGNSIFRRDFKCGAVVVNANGTGSGAVTVQLGKSYQNESGAAVTSVSLPGTSGSILRIANCTP